MKTKSTALLLGAVIAAVAGNLMAAPTVYRLTPPSALFTFNENTPPIIARFLPGQRFDLQTTVAPDAGKTITSVSFTVDTTVIGSTAASGTYQTSLITTGLNSTFKPGASIIVGGVATSQEGLSIPTGSIVASLRAYSNTAVGVHTFSVTATQSDSTAVTATGNFEIAPLTLNAGTKAKNIIIMLGDGHGIAHRTAARIMQHGVQQGKALSDLATDKFPYTGIVKTASLNTIVTDSAPGMACYSTGNKCNNNEEGVFPDDTVAEFDNPRVEFMGEYLHRTQGKSLGIVTTADVFDATPAANAVHTQNRGSGTGICDQYLDESVPQAGLSVLLGGGRKWFLPNTTVGSARSSSSTANIGDYVLPTDIVNGWGVAAGAVDASRDLLAGFQSAGFTYAPDKSTLTSVASGATKLLGLFAYSNMNVTKDKIDGRRGTVPAGRTNTVVTDYGFTDQPMLDEMTDAALTVLKKNPNGFVLMVEGASIDKQAHNMDSERFILDAIEFDNACAKAKAFADNTANGQTLVFVTADHECAGAAVIGASRLTNSALITASTAATTDNTATTASTSGAAKLRENVVGSYDNARFPQYPISGTDGYPTTTDPDYKLLIGYAANVDRYEDWLTNALPLQDSQQPRTSAQWSPTGTTPIQSSGIYAAQAATPIGRDASSHYLITGQVDNSNASAVHTASDIPCYATGRGASAFTGTMDNTDLFFRAMQAAIGGAK